MPSFIEGLHGLLKSGTQLPTLPTVVLQVHAVLEDDRKGAADAASVIERDPALTTRLLRAANSALYARGSDKVAAVQPAIQRVGLGQVRSLCLVLGVVQAFGGHRRLLSHEALWAHSGAVGATARMLLSRLNGRGPVSGDDIYVAGLLHDVGLLVLDQFFPEPFDQLAALRQEIELPLWQHEEDLLGMDHGDVGGLLLGSWGLPAGVVDAVTYHHRPDEAPEATRMLARVVHAAEALCTAVGSGLEAESPLGADAAVAVAALGLPDASLEELLSRSRDAAAQSVGVLA